MKAIGIIPSRYSSTRFPGKPLVDIGGKTMIRRVYEQAMKAKSLSKIIVATDDERIFNHVKSFGGKVVMTSSSHKNGTERCAEVAASSDADIIINIQGDEPFIEPEQLDLLASCLKNSEPQIATLIIDFQNEEEKMNPARVKVSVDEKFIAESFSRSIFLNQKSEIINQKFYKHIGLYGYRKEVLQQIVKLPPSENEIRESLEQLRWLDNGYKIQCAVTTYETFCVDTPEDLEKIKAKKFF